MSFRFKLGLWAAVWALTRLFMVAQVGFWDHRGIDFQDVNFFHFWSDTIAVEHRIPTEPNWQYPPGAAFLMLAPRIGGGEFGTSFVVTMLAVDLVGLGLVILLARRGGRDLGVWTWLLAIPVLGTLGVLRFDLAPTVLAIAALAVLGLRPLWFGALAGLGAMVKAWPLLVLFGEWDRRRLLRSMLAAVGVALVVFLVAQLAFGHAGGFLTNQDDRGLQVESVAASPWHLREMIDGTAVPEAERFGTQEIVTSAGDTVANVLDVVAFLALFAAAAWWWFRDRAIRRGREDLADPDLARDFVFAVVLLFIVTSRVLSPQYLIWMVGLVAVVLSSTRTRMLRPALVVLGAVVLTAGLYQDSANFVIRNLALLVAVIDAGWILVGALRAPSEAEAVSRVPRA